MEKNNSYNLDPSSRYNFLKTKIEEFKSEVNNYFEQGDIRNLKSYLYKIIGLSKKGLILSKDNYFPTDYFKRTSKEADILLKCIEEEEESAIILRPKNEICIYNSIYNPINLFKREKPKEKRFPGIDNRFTEEQKLLLEIINKSEKYYESIVSDIIDFKENGNKKRLKEGLYQMPYFSQDMEEKEQGVKDILDIIDTMKISDLKRIVFI